MPDAALLRQGEVPTGALPCTVHGRRGPGSTSGPAAALVAANIRLKHLRLALGLILQGANAADLTLATIATLLFMAEDQAGWSVAELATQLETRPIIVRRAIYALETRTLVARSRDPDNGRLVLFRLTHHGVKLVRRAGTAAAHDP